MSSSPWSLPQLVGGLEPTGSAQCAADDRLRRNPPLRFGKDGGYGFASTHPTKRRLDAEAAARHLAAERQALKVEKPPCPLQIRQRVRVGGREAFELGARGNLELVDVGRLLERHDDLNLNCGTSG